MDWRSALAIVVQVARAIQHAHEHGVVHRDLKPANIMLLDPGTSGARPRAPRRPSRSWTSGSPVSNRSDTRLTRTGQSFGTPLYMSPEQALGQRSDARSDIFSMGSILCTLLLGRPWFEAPSLPEIVSRVVHDDPPHLAILRPDLPASLDAVLAMALAKRADDRYATAADMADDLEDVLAGGSASHALLAGPTSAARDPGWPPTTRPARGVPRGFAVARIGLEPRGEGGRFGHADGAGARLDPRHDRLAAAAGCCPPRRWSVLAVLAAVARR